MIFLIFLDKSNKIYKIPRIYEYKKIYYLIVHCNIIDIYLYKNPIQKYY